MKFQRYAALAGVTIVGACALAACGTDNNATGASGGSGGGGVTAASLGVDCAKGTVNSSGSSAQANAMDLWRKTYQQACAGANLNYNPNGSGAGIQQFIQGATAFAGSDSALKPDEHTKADARCESGTAVDLPMVVGPIAVVYNLDGVDDLKLSPKNIAGIFAGKITKWNDPRIAKDNPDAQLPGTAIHSVHRSDESGTSDNFTTFLKATAPKAWTFAPGKKWVAPGGQGAKGSDGVAASVKQTPGSIAYDEYSYAMNGKLQTARVANGSGEFVKLSPASASKGVESAKIVGTGQDLTLKIDYATKEKGAYPIVLTTYEVTCTEGLPAEQAKLVKSFLSYAVSDKGQRGLTELGYAPLPSSIQTKVQHVVTGIS